METEELKLDLESITAQRALPRGETLLEVMDRLDTISKSAETPDRLRHYLERRSYVKALEYLGDPSVPHHR
ncbi:MAG: hypothetical protein GVY36_02420 [Verrucomicrobia bacterium]|jgi:hypothetical protein|nr:hypothetical protein [Verrucomicrobiota bacterium]